MITGVIHGHSEYSCKDSALSVKRYLQTVKDLGGRGAVLTDHGLLTGIPDLIKEAPKIGIKGIPGIEFYVVTNDDLSRRHLIVFAKDYQGYQAIMRAATESQRNMVKGFPCLKEEKVPEFFGDGAKGHGHVYATSACVQGVICHYFIKNQILQERVTKLARKASEGNYQNPDDGAYLAKKAKLDENDKQLAAIDAELESLKQIAAKKFGNLERTINAHKAKGLDVSFKELTLMEEKAKAEEAKRRTDELKAQRTALMTTRKELVAFCREAEKSHDKYRATVAEIETISAQMMPEEQSVELAIAKAKWYNEVFGDGNFFLEFQNHGLDWEETAYPLLERVMDMTGIEPIASNDSHYATSSEDDIRGRWLVQSMRFNKAEEVGPTDGEYYIKTDEQLREMLVKLVREDTADRAIANIGRAIDACDVVLPTELHFPKFNTGTSETSTEYLRRMAFDAIKRRYPGKEWTERHQERLEYELSVIDELGFSDYLCIVENFLQEGRKLGCANEDGVGMGVGPGRGSAAGSLVCYLVGITDIDPMRFNLLFERFLNKDRVSYPDIDSDFHTVIRAQVIDYVKGRYGEDGVCGIITEGTLAAKNAVRSVARVLGTEEGNDAKEYAVAADQICALIPQTPGVKLDDVKEQLDAMASGNPIAAQILKDARIIEGTIIQYGMHAAGIILADQGDVGEYVPLAFNEDKAQWVSQYTGPDDEKLAKILKMDFLGLKNLDIITDALRLIYHDYGIKLDMSEVGRTLVDGRTTAYDRVKGSCIDEIFAKGRTNGVFQFESPGMKSLLKRFRPQTIDDIALLNAVFRPGPIQYIDKIVETRRSGKMPEQILPVLNTVLKDTYGYPVYQESVMRICHEVAGMTMGQADKIRWAMSKKHAEVLEEYQDKFVDGLVNAGAARNAAEQYWTDLQNFAKYAFNKSHAVAYSFLAFYTAWLKYNYPVEYFTSLLNHSASEKYEGIIGEAQEMGIKILPPDICESDAGFTCNKGGIRFGLTAISGIKGAADAILNERKNSPFKSYEEFLTRSTVSDSVVKALVFSGCFDRFHKNRSVLSQMIERVRDAHKSFMKAQGECEAAENELNACPDDDKKKRDKLAAKYDKAQTKAVAAYKLLNEQKYPEICDETPEKLSQYEREYLGVCLSWNPLEEYGDLSKYSDLSISEAQVGQGRYCGVIKNVVTRIQRDGGTMVNFVLADRTAEINCVCFASAYATCTDAIQNGKVVVVIGRVREDQFRSTDEEKFLQLMVNSCETLERKLPILTVTYDDVLALKKYRQVFDLYEGGDYEVRLIDGATGRERHFATKPHVYVRAEILNVQMDRLHLTVD